MTVIDHDCRMETYHSGAYEVDELLCTVKRDDKNIRVEYFYDGEVVAYRGIAEHQGHYVLECPEKSDIAYRSEQPDPRRFLAGGRISWHVAYPYV
ncbi:hypothetical protein CBM2626_U40008 [Cupriavidus taiwanensis]|uniref:Uncharacterized protein n=1 Tax=Cupriavidus taiwanensis TaxID=164546 RepID=A0A375HFB4_9BURK|nr:hypothetical protein CBM2614_U40008 [Cupriavidus taiwanensis]SOZ73883.1 hypothetical protein CBM2615_U30008 [Cupriavidus taiwanensis]SOZ75328.1 hypothetical protein CBM2613_U30008 [Cupriavidus taiwanensis]SPA03870.1 hypothetical protein CBM2626_U40008 [Cupriavidus taiwanensis]SPA12947.1 hypothetical protein CBM2625_U70013 [Cupriavidus taiwanensis]